MVMLTWQVALTWRLGVKMHQKTDDGVDFSVFFAIRKCNLNLKLVIRRALCGRGL